MGHNVNYIWAAYGIVFVVLIIQLWIAARRQNKNKSHD